MKESFFYKAFEVAFTILAGSALYAVISGHCYHSITFGACVMASCILGHEAKKSKNEEDARRIDDADR